MSNLNGRFCVGWQSQMISDLRYFSAFADALAFFNQLVYRETMIQVGLSEGKTLNGPLVMIATWSPATGVMRSTSHPLAHKVVRESIDIAYRPVEPNPAFNDPAVRREILREIKP